MDEQGRRATTRCWPTSSRSRPRPSSRQNQTYSYTFTKSGSFGYRDALHTNRRGTVVVRSGVSITAAPALLAYGKSATLSGSISSGAVGDTVNVDAMECGKTGFTRVDVRQERGERRLELARQAGSEHRLPGELAERRRARS